MKLEKGQQHKPKITSKNQMPSLQTSFQMVLNGLSKAGLSTDLVNCSLRLSVLQDKETELFSVSYLVTVSLHHGIDGLFHQIGT